MKGGKCKKRAWGVKQNGLYGWKMVVVDEKTSSNIQNKKNHTQPASNKKRTSESDIQKTPFKNWLVTPKIKVGGGGQPSDTVLLPHFENNKEIIEAGKSPNKENNRKIIEIKNLESDSLGSITPGQMTYL